MEILVSILVMTVVITIALVPTKREEDKLSRSYTNTANEMKKGASKV